MTAIPCRFFDGRTSAPHEATLTITPDRNVVVTIVGIESQRVHDLTDVRIPSRIADTPRHLLLPDGAVCEVRDNDTLDAMRARAEHEPLPAGRRFERLLHRLDSSWRGAATALVVTAAILYSFTQWGAPLVAGVVVAATPPEVEAVIGANVLTLFDQFNIIEPSELDPNRRNELLAAFTEMKEDTGVADTELRFYSGRRLGANAFALPGGTVVVTDELVELAEHDEEIIAVLAHELGHVEGRHVMRRLAQTSSMLVVWTAFTGDVSVAGLSIFAPDRLLAQSYSRNFERDADGFAFDYLGQAGIPPTRLGDILRRLERMSGTGGMPVWSSSHPGAEERSRNAEEAEAQARDSAAGDE
ncbi:MAG: M48 family metallopeptidase [Acidobacteriota bacterium]|nr:M48 family metallopeptidase [Acidobacteriota bacterium]MDE2924355.1 M48 family metallopeptidase [Acidobacteriota bacterium]MDE3264005.1 M48 family metallopeptidase [Acidobacteriota bacterium]